MASVTSRMEEEKAGGGWGGGIEGGKVGGGRGGLGAKGGRISGSGTYCILSPPSQA